jgi:pyruvate, water dikinase
MTPGQSAAAVVSFADLPADASSIAGGKGASLGRMSGAGFPVPPGFVVCAEAFEAFLDGHHTREAFTRLTASLDVHDERALEEVSHLLRSAILSYALPAGIDRAIRQSYSGLGAETAVAVRSSAVAEDGEAASFAGQQETFLNVRGAATVIEHVRECWASFFSPRALFYRAQKGALADTRMAVVVQEMACAEKSGVLFTVDPVSKRRDRLVVEAVFGLGEGIVSGLLTPDHYVLDRSTGAPVDEFIAIQTTAIVHDSENGGIQTVELSEEQGGARVLSASQLSALLHMGLRLEKFFGKPQDVEWCIRRGELLLLQSRPITTM